MNYTVKFVILVESTPAYNEYSCLKDEVRISTENHFHELMEKLQKTKERHCKELKAFVKMKMKKSNDTWASRSVSSLRKKTASVSPRLEVESHVNVALEVMEDGETGKSEQSIRDSFV